MSARRPLLETALCVATLSILVAGCAAPTIAATDAPEASAPTFAPAEGATAAAPPPSREMSSPAPPSPAVTPVPLFGPPYDNREDPVSLLASYYDAVNRQEYRRAWEYWENPPSSSYEEFVTGYGETAHVLLVVSPPTHIEGAAGSQYVSIPTLLISTHIDGSQHNFVGCYVARRANPDIEGAPADGWLLFSATVAATPGNTSDATLLAQACSAQ